ncbi:hypothetical protein, partial [uncultured Succinatimonas sp.]|uniref:hypothetical protein n=1 Tax=uncultured Succinatimonas sp. TaxID=1262973 RepID=UPI0025F642A6
MNKHTSVPFQSVRLKPLAAGVIAACLSFSTASSYAAQVHFDPQGREEIDEEVVLETTDTTVSPIGIHLSGDDTNDKDTKLTFNNKVSINYDGTQHPDSNWSAYGIWISNSVNHKAELTLNGALDMDIKGTTNMLVGLMSGSRYNPTGGAQGQDNGTTMYVNGPVSMDISGNSVTAAVAGSHFNNNTNPGGKIVFGSNDIEGKNVFNITSDWSDKFNSNRDSDWAVGLLSFDKGEMIVDRDTEINLNIKNFETTYTGTYSEDEYADIAAAVYVDRESSFELKENRSLNISITSLNPAIKPGGSWGKPNAAAPSFGIMAGAHEAAYQPENNSVVNLNGSTSINLYLNPKDPDEQQSEMTGVGVFGGAELTANAPLVINMDYAEGSSAADVDASDSSVYGLWAGKYPSTVMVNIKGSGNINVFDALSINLPQGVNPALENFMALRATGYTTNDKWSTLNINNTVSKAPVKINGTVYADDGGYINMNITGAQSSLTSNISLSEISSHNSYIYLTLSDHAVWNALEHLYDITRPIAFDNSNENVLTKLTLNSGTLNMSRPQELSQFDQLYKGFEKVRITSSFNAVDGQIIMDSDISSAEKVSDPDNDNLPTTDQIEITGTAENAEASVQVNFINKENIPADKFYSLNWLVRQNDGSMTLTGPDGKDAFTGRGMVSMWSLRFVPEGQSDKLADNDYRESLTNKGDGKGDWYLVRYDYDVPDPEPEPDPDTPEEPDNPNPDDKPTPNPDPVLPPEVDTNLNIGT